MDTTYQLVQDFASISWNKARTQKFHPFPWHFLTPFRHFFGDCYIVLLNQGGCATISCWDDHKAYQKLSPWLVVAVCSHRFLYIPIRSKMHICTYIYIYIYIHTRIIYICVYHPYIPMFSSMFHVYSHTFVFWQWPPGLIKLTWSRHPQDSGLWNERTGGDRRKYPWDAWAGGGIPRLNTGKWGFILKICHVEWGNRNYSIPKLTMIIHELMWLAYG